MSEEQKTLSRRKSGIQEKKKTAQNNNDMKQLDETKVAKIVLESVTSSSNIVPSSNDHNSMETLSDVDMAVQGLVQLSTVQENGCTACSNAYKGDEYSFMRHLSRNDLKWMNYCVEKLRNEFSMTVKMSKLRREIIRRYKTSRSIIQHRKNVFCCIALCFGGQILEDFSLCVASVLSKTNRCPVPNRALAMQAMRRQPNAVNRVYACYNDVLTISRSCEKEMKRKRSQKKQLKNDRKQLQQEPQKSQEQQESKIEVVSSNGDSKSMEYWENVRNTVISLTTPDDIRKYLMGEIFHEHNVYKC